MGEASCQSEPGTQPCVSQHPTQEIGLEITRRDSVLLTYSERGILLPWESSLHLPLRKNPLSQPRGGGLELDRWLGEHGVRSKAEGRPRRTFSQTVVDIDCPVTVPTSQQHPSSFLGSFLSFIVFRLWGWLIQCKLSC